jgi:hypothetical protein
MPRKAVVNLYLIVISLLVSGVVAEIVLRAGTRGKFGPRPGFFVGDQEIGWKPAANLNHTYFGPDFEMQVRTDAEGYRLGELGEVDFEKSRLIILIGDSYTFGWGVGTKETFASYLDMMVSEETDGAVRVVNLGVGGYGTLQSHMRLARFLDDHPNAAVVAVVMTHSPNDPVDNVNSIGYHLGVWEVIDRQPKSRNALHLVNFADYLMSVLENKRGGSFPAQGDSTVTPFFQDVAFAFDYKLPRSLPPEVTLNGITIDLTDLSSDDYSKPHTRERKSMSRIQRELTRESVRSIHRLLSERSVRIVHEISASSAAWFERQMAVMLEHIVSDGDNVTVLGAFPDAEAYGADYINAHAGKHYTPEFNAYWAAELFNILQRDGVLDSAQAN